MLVVVVCVGILLWSFYVVDFFVYCFGGVVVVGYVGIGCL